MMSDRKLDLTGVTLKVLFICGLLVASVWIVQPFLPALVWATTLVIATWPLMLRVQGHAGNSRGIAVVVMIAGLCLFSSCLYGWSPAPSSPTSMTSVT